MKTRMLSTISISAACLALLAAPAIAKSDKDKGKGKGPSLEQPGKGNSGKGNSGKPGKDDFDIQGHPGNKGGPKHNKFDDNEHNELLRLFAPSNRSNLPPGLQKNLERGKPLPPGWQKKMAAGQIMDASWLDLLAPVSYDDLPGIRRQPGTRMYYHDNRLVRISEQDRMILEVVNLLTR